MNNISPLTLSKKGHQWVLFLTGFLFLLMLARAQDEATANPASRFATVDSLVHRGTFVINESRFLDSVDRIKIGENFYSSKPPIVAVLAAGPYWLYHQITGLSLKENTATVIKHLNVLLFVLPYFILVFYFLRFLQLTMKDEKAFIFAYAIFLFNCLAAGYATDMNNHSPAAIVLFVAFYYAYWIRRGQSQKVSHWLICGLMAGFLPTLEHPGAFVSLALFIYLARYDFKKTLLYFVPASLPPMALHFYLVYIATGSLIPAYMRPELYRYEGSYWTSKNLKGLDGAKESKAAYLFHMLIGHHGIFSLTPVFIPAFIKMLREIRSKGKEYEEALLTLLSLIILVAFYNLTTHNYGGVCVGYRWLVFFMPLLFIFVARWLEESRHAYSRWMIFAFIVGMIALNKATINPWSQSYWYKLLKEIGLGSV